jgi:hypothetical protein
MRKITLSSTTADIGCTATTTRRNKFSSGFKFFSILLLVLLVSGKSWGQATLPFSYDLGKPSSVTGLTHTGLGTDYSSSPKMKFDTSGDNLILNFSGTPGTLTFKIQWNQSTSATRFPGDFTLQQSPDGVTYSTVQLYNSTTGTALANGTFVTETVSTLLAATRYIKWIYTTKSNGNIAIGAISLSSASSSAPILTADASANTVDNNIDITFPDDITWRGLVTAVKIGSMSLSASDYLLSAGNLQLKPSNGNALLTASGSKSVVVVASGYADATVTQAINAGAPTANSTSAISIALAPNTTRTISCTAKDQYNNLVLGYTFKYDVNIINNDATTAESYTIDGTARTSTTNDINVVATTNASGVATFTAALPTTIDPSDGISIQPQLSNGSTNIGSALAFTQLASQTITFGALSAVNYGDAPFGLTGSASSGLTVSYASSNTAVATVSGTTVTIVGAGSTNITASQAGNGSYNAASNVVQLLTVNPIALTLPDAAASSKTYTGTNEAVITGTLTGIINSDAVTLSGTGTFADANVANGIAVTSTSTLTGLKAGNYTLTQPTGLTANITPASQSITFAALANKTMGDADYAPGATSVTSGINPITYTSSNTAVATIVAGQIHIVAPGTTDITASQAASANYAAAPDVIRALTVVPLPIAAWDFTGVGSVTNTTIAATTFDANLISSSGGSDISRGAGAAWSSANNSFRTVGFQNNGISTSNTDYFQVTIQAGSAKRVSLSTIDANFNGTATYTTSPGVTSQFAYSLNGTDFTLIGSPFVTIGGPVSMSQIDLSGVSALQNVVSGTTITLRYYASGQTSTGGWGFYSAASGTKGLAIGGTVVSNVAPSVTTTTANPIGTTSASFNGMITSGGSDALTARGFSYRTTTGVLISDNQTAEGGTTTGAYSKSVTGLSVNTQYFYKAYATNVAGTTLSGTEINFYTLANVPSAPTVNNATTSTLDVAVNANGNPAATEFAIQETGGNYVQADGTLGVSAVWQTAATWGTKTVTGLTINTSYTFKVIARNGAATETDFSGTTSLSTSSTINVSSSVNASTLPVCESCNVTVANGGELTNDGSADRTYNSITVSGGGKLTNPSGSTLRLTTLTLKSDGNGTGTYVDKGTSAITSASVNQDLASVRNWYISSPITTADRSMLPAGTLWKYNEPNTATISGLGTALWEEMTTDEAIEAKKGYIFKPTAIGLISFTGTLNTGDQTVTLNRTENGKTGRGFNLVGNPYPSYVNWMSAIDAGNTVTSNLSTTLWYRTKNPGTYVDPVVTSYFVFDTYNKTANTGTNNNGGGNVTSMIPPMQAFWVKVNAAVDNQSTTGTLKFTNAMRSHEIGTNRLKAPSEVNINQKVLRLKLSNLSSSDESIVLFNSNASDSYDAYDSPKMSNANAAIPEIYTTVGGEQLVINGLNSVGIANRELPLGFTTGARNNFTIKATEISNFDADTRVILKDNLLKSEYELNVGNAYNFSSDVVNTSSRFSILFRSATGPNALYENNFSTLYIGKNANNQITINGVDAKDGMVTVCNAVGQKLISTALTSSSLVIDKPFSTGVYMVTVNVGNAKVTKKVIVN